MSSIVISQEWYRSGWNTVQKVENITSKNEILDGLGVVGECKLPEHVRFICPPAIPASIYNLDARRGLLLTWASSLFISWSEAARFKFACGHDHGLDNETVLSYCIAAASRLGVYWSGQENVPSGRFRINWECRPKFYYVNKCRIFSPHVRYPTLFVSKTT